MKRLVVVCALLCAVAAAGGEAVAYTFPERWNTGAGIASYGTTTRFVDLNGDGSAEIVCLMSSPTTSGRLAVRIFDPFGRALWTGPDLLSTSESNVEVRLVDVDQNGRLDYVLHGPTLDDGVTNYFVIGHQSDFGVLDALAMPSSSAFIVSWFHAQLEPDTGLELIVNSRQVPGPYLVVPRLRLHFFGQAGFAANWVPGNLTDSATLSAEAHDLNANGIDELYVTYAGRIWMYSSDAAVAAVAPDAERVPLTMSSPFPNPTTGDATIRYRLSHGAAPVLRVLDAAGRGVRQLSLPLQPAGEHEYRWDGKLEDGRHAAPGMYWLELDAAGVTTSRRVVRLR